MQLMKRFLIMMVTCFALTAQAQTDSAAVSVLRFGYLSYDSALYSMPAYALVKQNLAELRVKYDAEQKRVEDEFNRKYEEFLEGQKDFPPTILRKRQTELKDMMERNIAFRQVGQEELRRAEAELMAPLRQRLSTVLAELARQRGLAFILNTDSIAAPYINPEQGDDLNQPVLDALSK